MKTKTARQEYESCPQMDDFRSKEQMELNDIKITNNDDNGQRKCDACQCTHFQGLAEFCVKSNLHGLKYVGEPNNHISIRLLWAVAFSIAILTATYFIRNVYRKWEDSPVILTVDSRVAQIQEIPFPAVTICPPLVLRKHYANLLLERTNNLFDFNLGLVQSFCKEGSIDWRLANNTKELEITRNFEKNLRLNCEDIFRRSWMTIDYDTSMYIYSQYVSVTPTLNMENRLCCTFNGMKPELMYRNLRDNYIINNSPNTSSFDWNIETGFGVQAELNRSTMPLRPFKIGYLNGLNVFVKINDTYCNRKTYFKMSIHHPGEEAEFFNTDFFINTGGNYKYKVTPRLTTAEETLRQINVQQRNCYFSSEKYLRFYRTYTEQNCLLDCLANVSLAECNCLPHYLPETEGLLFCNNESFSCFIDMYFSVFEGERHKKCDCLPPCTELKYLVTEQYTPLSSSLQNSDLEMHIYFSELRFYPYHRSAIYTFSEMLANLGGLLGLFLGFSFLSIIEIFYFVCIGICKFLQGRWKDIHSKCYNHKCSI